MGTDAPGVLADGTGDLPGIAGNRDFRVGVFVVLALLMLVVPSYVGALQRGIAYFASHQVATAYYVIAAWAVFGIALSLAFAGRDNPVLWLSQHA